VSATLTITGLAELRAELQKLPADLKGEGKQIVIATANGFATTMRRKYLAHRRSGNLATTVYTAARDISYGGAYAVVTAASRHAAPFEQGSDTRRTKKGWNRGRMPAADLFIPAAIAARRAMWGELADLVRRKGFTVSGDGS